MSYVFLDTNTLLHFKRPDQIDWCALVKARSVTLVFAPVVIRELEVQKVQNPIKRIRDRAHKVVTWLSELVDTAPPTFIRPEVAVHFVRTSPLIDFTAHHLSRAIFDDELIATVLEFRGSAAQPVRIATTDLGLRLKLPTHNIEAFTLPDSERLPAVLDDADKETAELRRKLQQYENRQPKLSLNFANGKMFGPIAPIEIDRQKTIEIPSSLIGNYVMGGPSETTYSKYLREINNWITEVELLCPCDLMIQNSGTAEATDVGIDFTLPEFVSGIADIRARPRPPRSFFDADYPHFDVTSVTSHLKPRPVSRPYIGDNGDIAFRIPKLIQHRPPLSLDRFYWKFASKEAIQNFSIAFTITFAETVEPLKGTLSFLVSQSI